MTTDRLEAGCGANVHDDSCALAELPDNPFTALRVAAGMLLGESDFRVMLGNPRGKLMLHNSWLHGTGVVWGLPVNYDKDLDTLYVGSGLAVDGWGRELRLERTWCVNLLEWAREWTDHHPIGDSGTETSGCARERSLHAWIVIEPSPCLDRKVPALADPCDVTREHDDWSRVVEQSRIRIVDRNPAPRVPYHRVRALLGLDPVEPGDEAGHEAREEAERVAAQPVHNRAPALLAAMRRMAAADVTQLRPPGVPGSSVDYGLHPTSEDEAPVVLAGLVVDIAESEDCVRVRSVHVDERLRHAIVPTTTIQELVCGLAPGFIGDDQQADAGGPRLRGPLQWNDTHTRLRVWLSAAAAPGSEEESVEISSLSSDGRGWSYDQIRSIHLTENGHCIEIDLDHAPSYETVRVIIRGTGRTPLFGNDPRVPFAGTAEGPPGTAHDGHDAVLTQKLRRPHEEDSQRNSASPQPDREEWR
jgi:hypothetical protein